MSAIKSNMVIYAQPDKAPVELVTKEQMTLAVNRIRAIVPDGDKMSNGSILAIAQEAILYRIVPGRDMHYYEKGGKLQRIPDYKYLKNFVSFKEQMLSGDDSAVVEDTYRVLSDEEKLMHGLAADDIAAECRITTKREREQFAAEVKRWKETGFSVKDALELARETYQFGTTAVGAWRKGDTVPKGWSPLQVAEKLAFKNSVNRKYGIPTADEMAAMAHHMARRASGRDWKLDYIDQSVDVQARLADLEMIAAEVQAEELTADERRVRLAKNVTLTRDTDNEAIGEDEPQGWRRFVATVLQSIPWYGAEVDISRALVALDLSYDAANEEMIFDEMARYASKEADKEAA